MATKNNRLTRPQAATFNTAAFGGLVTARIQSGYDNVISSSPDGLDFPVGDRFAQYVRGNLTGQEWTQIIALLTGTLGTGVFYGRKAGTAEATGYVKHTVTAPILHNVGLHLKHRAYASADAAFECRFPDEDAEIADVWTPTDSQAAPTYIAAARAAEITAAVHGTTDIYHVMSLDLNIILQLVKASNDGDKGYTCVDAYLGGTSPTGQLVIQDMGVTASAFKAETLLANARGNLVLSIKEQGGTSKTLTIAGVEFTTCDQNSDAGQDYDSSTLNFVITNDASTPLTLAGTNKLLAVA